jgi:hypothetical protein
MLLEAFMSRRWGINARLLAICDIENFRKRTPFFEKIRKNAEPHRNRNGVHGNFKNIQHQVFLRKLPGQSSRKVSKLFRHDRGLCGFSTLKERSLPACSYRQLSDNTFT